MLVPAMTGHLGEAKSSDPLQKQLSLNRLNIFMMVLRRIQDIYSSATFIHGLFSQAIDKMTAPEHYYPGQTPTTGSMVKSNGHLAMSLDPPHWDFDFEVWDTAPHYSDVSIVS